MATYYPRLTEPVRHAVAATLRANLPAALTAVWAAYASVDAADGITVPAPTLKAVYSRNKYRKAEYPSITVTGPRGRLEQDGLSDWQGWAHEVHIVVDLISDNDELLDTLCTRYLEAIWQVLMANQFLDGTVSGLCGVSLTDYQTASYRETPGPGGPGRLHVCGLWKLIVRVDEAA